MRTWLITGGAGFIGSNLISYLIAGIPDLRVLNLDCLTYAGNPAHLADVEDNPRYTFVEGDIRDAGLVRVLLDRNDVDAIVNLAAESHVDRSIADPGVFARTNVEGTLTLLECARDAWQLPGGGYRPGCKFMQMSTDEVYGSIETGRFTERSPIAPRSPYSASKASADLFVQAFAATYGLPVNIVRSANNFGPCQHTEKLIPTIISRALSLRQIPIYGDGLQVREWIAAADCAHAIRLVIERGVPGEVYNVGSGWEKTNLELTGAILQILHDSVNPRISPALITHVEDRKGHDRRYALDCSKINSGLDFSCGVDFADYLRYTIGWYVNQLMKNE